MTLRARPARHRGRAWLACAAAGVAVASALLGPGTARGDGDPASDVLLLQNVFYSYVPAVSQAVQDELNTTVSRAHAAGFPVKVALISGPLELGAIPQVFGHPEEYAKFLDYEISFTSPQRVLVVMPQGFGTSDAGPVSALAGIRIRAGQANGLALAAVAAVGRLARLAGHPIVLPAAPSAGGAGIPWGAVLGAAALLLVVLGASAAFARRRRRSPLIRWS